MKRLIPVSLLLLSACGTVFSGSNQSMNFDSNVKNVSIYVNGAMICSSTPCQVDIERSSSSLMVLAKADGYEDNIQQVRSKINPVSWGNLLSVYSWTTDFATSSMWKYSRDGVYINMKPVNIRKAELETFKRDSEIRHFALMNYGELKAEAAENRTGEYIHSLANLSGICEQKLVVDIRQAKSEVDLANQLTLAE